MDTQPISKDPAALAAIFNQDYLNGKALYLYLTGKIPSITFMNEIDPFDAIAAFRKTHDSEIADWYNEAVWNPDSQGFGMENCFFVLKNQVILHFGHNFVHMLHDMNDWPYIESLARLFAPCRVKEEI
ncbi:hypothetical protein [Sediminibacterium soli]|uniref:hypothetical protein n=1 Tax=Sediminibacterium soli TaxID=2698829 RepID=UPI001379EF9A|nr:hypothetical protein [Sediminibacterium soli]NCI48094.1 hypothetical protein [Sediminibacterium soli]